MKKRILFLLRTYNDIDHITPVIWKTVTVGWPTHILFVNDNFKDDYRIQFVVKNGANLLHSTTIEWYHRRFRKSLAFSRCLSAIFDRVVSYSLGWNLLRRHRIEVVVNEWSGATGREMAAYLLRPARFLGIQNYSLPHGYFIWRNSLFNQNLANFYELNGCFPDFTERNFFSRYVVQSTEQKAENIRYGMSESKIVVLGSARFCKEWSDVNQRVLSEQGEAELHGLGFRVLFFLPHWDYNVNREACVNLLGRIVTEPGICLIIKGHTRGTGALNNVEKHFLQESGVVNFADDSVHSTALIKAVDVVINFGSSIGFEAIRQEKPVINAKYLHENDTFFDGSGVVHDADDEDKVMKFIELFQSGSGPTIEKKLIDEFMAYRVDGGEVGRDVLADYLHLLSGS